MGLFFDEEHKKEKEVKKEKKLGMFDYHKKLFNGKLPKEEFKKVSEYMLLQHLSSEPKFIETLNQFNVMAIPQEKSIELIQLLFGKVGFVRYPSKPKIKKSVYLEAVKWYFKINDEMAYKYLKYLKNSTLKEIQENFNEFNR